MKIGYLKTLGKNELTRAVKKWENLYKEKISLEPVSYEEIETKVQSRELDAVLINSRKDIFRSLETYEVKDSALVSLVQAGNFNKYQQTIEIDDLKNVPSILVASVDGEKSEYHYYKDILKVKSDLIAVETLGEALLMVESGSGYLIMNENTAAYIDDDQVQKMFLLRNGQQLTEKYVLVGQSNDKKIEKFSLILRDTFN